MAGGGYVVREFLGPLVLLALITDRQADFLSAQLQRSLTCDNSDTIAPSPAWVLARTRHGQRRIGRAGRSPSSGSYFLVQNLVQLLAGISEIWHVDGVLSD